MKRSIILLSLAMILVLPLMIAEQTNAPTQQYNKIFLNPFYTNTINQYGKYNFTVTINPANKVGNIVSALLTFHTYARPTVAYNLTINGQWCNNRWYNISTTDAGASMADLFFDCSNIITQAGTYNISLWSNKAGGATTAWLDLVYSTSPPGSATIHGTEYTYGQFAKPWLQLINSTGSAISNGVCYVDIYTPTGGIYLEGATMTNMHHDGIYYYDFAVPIIQGVYPVIAKCYYVAGQSYNFGTTIVAKNGTIDTGTIATTYVLDGVYMTGTESSVAIGDPRRYWSEINFTNGSICSNISSELLNGISLYWTGRWNSNLANDVITFYVWNYTSSSWLALSNTITGSGTGVKSVTNSLSLNNTTVAGLVNSSGSNFRLKIQDTNLSDGSSSAFDVDYLSLACDQLASPAWQTVMGSSEMHVSSDLPFGIDSETIQYIVNDNITIQLWNGTNITENYYTGIFNNTFVIASGTSTTENYLIEYQGMHSIPCNSIISFYMINSTGVYPYNYTTQRQTEEDHCSINFYLDLLPAENTRFEVHARNVWESEIRSTNTGVNAIAPLLDAGCQLWRISKGYPQYIVPKNQTNEIYDYYYRACANWYDDYYWFNLIYTKSLTDKSLIIDEQTYLQYESDYTSLIFAENKLNTVTYLLLNNLVAVNSFSKLLMDNPLQDIAPSPVFGNVNTTNQRYWANYSSAYQIWKDLNASCGTGKCRINGTDVWNYSEGRNLTYIPTVNATLSLGENEYGNISNYVWNSTNRSLTYTDNFASAVWGYNGTIVPNIIQTIVNNTWSYTGIVGTNLLNQLSNSVWSFNGNSTTYMVSTVVNSTWSATARYTHGVILS